jgi:hypothetical protein
MGSDPNSSPVERMLKERQEPEHSGRRLSSRAMQSRRSLEAYLKAGNRPRWMERLAEIEQGVATERRRLARAHRTLARECGHDPEAFARCWRHTAEAWDFTALNALIRQHNEWYPIERELPMDPRTRDYILVHGRSHRRPLLDAAWVLQQLPATS